MAVATSFPSAVFKFAVSEPAAGAGVDVAEVAGEALWTGGVVPVWLVACWGELQAVTATTGSDSKTAAAASLVMPGA
ncbi:hypothetical protein AWB91_01980 [Mycobacterium paraense]|uniref:Uncharacterized protein n=1 Tax=Mycobacterium paraense TaxID=767916 RepID=A0ABX3VHF3_9MYCO|nr:hypothetical protein AWB91_01980 [Mycobacterium paraense]ORW35813.1 hypothetical protein AWB88_01980 [Mycobacterium paraense]